MIEHKKIKRIFIRTYNNIQKEIDKITSKNEQNQSYTSFKIETEINKQKNNTSAIAATK